MAAHPTLTSFYAIWTNYPLTLKPFDPLGSPPNSYIILGHLDKLTPHLTPFYPPWQLNSYLMLPLWTNYPLTLTSFYPLGSPTLTSFYPLRTNYPLTLTPFYPPWQPNSYLILTPLDKLPPHSYTILPPLEAQLLHHFTPSWQITPSLLHNFTPLGSPHLTSSYPLWTNYPLTPTPFYSYWQPNSYNIFPPLDNIPPHSYTNLPPLAAQLLHHFTPMTDQKRSKSEGLFCLLHPHSYTILPPWKPNAAQKDVRVSSCIFLKNPPIAAPLLRQFTHQSYIVLAPILEECQS